ncbi:dirigent protein 22-like [Salvia miltiorrhiza]|uniref:dirigent protein 22-like n=1 Tax=Salvia miltiorrhiza TaxID=226208 RepID=UPI0025AC6B1A|nr:dirigent protein 22-like [Salvia miltiorrhiza]
MEKLNTVIVIICISSLLLAVSESKASHGKKKVTRLQFYLHDMIGGEKPTVWAVARCNLSDVLASKFGKVLVLDNLVTSGADMNSSEVGRLQGTVGQADLRERALVMLLNLVFTKGEYEGSTLSIVGRNPLEQEVREVSIVGGTAAFRMATGYILTRTYFRDPARVHSVYQYNAVVYHMDRSVLSSRR